MSNLGDGITYAALPLLLVANGQPSTLLGGVMAAMHGPRVLAPLLGALADRLPPRGLMIFVDVLRAVAVAGMAWLGDQTAWPALVGLHLLAFALGTGDVLHDCASVAYVPTLVPDEELEAANGKLIAVQTVAGALLGAPLGAALFVWSHRLPLLIDAGTFLAAGLVLLSLPAHAVSREGPGRVRTVVAEGLEALRFVWAEPRLRLLSLTAAPLSFVVAGVQAMLVVYARRELGASELAYGALLTAFAVGGAVGGVSVGLLVRRVGGAAVGMGPVAIGLAIVALSRVTVIPLAGAVLVVGGFGFILFDSLLLSARQRFAPDDMRGRVYSVGLLITSGMAPLGAMTFGALADTALRPTFLVGGGVAALAGAVLLLRRRLLALGPASSTTRATTDRPTDG